MSAITGRPGGGQVTILVTIGAAVGVVYIARLAGRPNDILKQPGQMLRIAIGGSVVTIVLLVLSDASPPLAKSLAWLILLGTVIGYGSSTGEIAAKLISGALGKLPSTTPSAASGDNASTPNRIAAGPDLRYPSPTSPYSGSPRIAPRSAWDVLTGQP